MQTATDCCCAVLTHNLLLWENHATCCHQKHAAAYLATTAHILANSRRESRGPACACQAGQPPSNLRDCVTMLTAHSSTQEGAYITSPPSHPRGPRAHLHLLLGRHGRLHRVSLVGVLQSSLETHQAQHRDSRRPASPLTHKRRIAARFTAVHDCPLTVCRLNKHISTT